LHAESAREVEANAIQHNQASQAAACAAQAKSAASEQKQERRYEEYCFHGGKLFFQLH
jgi:hypothetical protein